MTSRSPIHPRTFVQVIVAFGVVLVTAALIAQLRAAKPHETPAFLVEGAEDADDPGAEIVSCERTLPGADEDASGDGSAEPTLLGRVTSSRVLECPEAFDGHLVTYIGEVIGDVLHRDDGAWVLMNDDDYALEVGPLASHGEFRGYNSGLSVWLDGDLPDLVTHPGGPDWRGDVLQVEGIIHRVDPRDGGGLTIRATDAQVLAEAVPLSHPVNRPQAIAAGLLSAAAVALVVFERAAARRR
ncbi:MAG: hypothetical protein KY461_13395 [Actinobacteria bacterium]|nr:hypothetical protein [Actinomycetota bacterium]